MEEGKKKAEFWPTLDTEESAKKLLRYGVGAALFTAVVTALFAAWALGAQRKAMGYVGPASFIDTAIFVAIAFGIYKRSRAAAVGGMLFFILEKVYQIHLTGQFQGAWMALTLICCYVQAIRATYFLHDLGRHTQSA